MANSISSVTTGTGGIVLESVDTSGNTNIKSGTTTIVAVSSTGAAVTGTLSASGGIAKASLPTGSVLQVVSATYSTATSSSSASYVDTGITATITPTSATSKILCIVTHGDVAKSGSDTYASIKLLRAGSTIMQPNLYTLSTSSTLQQIQSQTTIYLDSPATTSATIYKTQFATAGSGAVVLFQSSTTGSITLMEIAA